ncbi:hypothetical protein U1Q18_038901, partial [Sarracenia purpurea var. burkii]
EKAWEGIDMVSEEESLDSAEWIRVGKRRKNKERRRDKHPMVQDPRKNQLQLRSQNPSFSQPISMSRPSAFGGYRVSGQGNPTPRVSDVDQPAV